MKAALALRHVAFEDLGNLGPVLAETGYRADYVDVPSERLEEIEPIGPDLVIVLGGPIGAYEEESYPFLLAELRLIERRLENRRPTLGICLGAQLIARALGARVYRAEGKEIGWSPLALSAAGRVSPLSPLEGVPVLHWHGDTFDLPVGAVHLASTEKVRNQAFSWGGNALAVQFHPEASAEGLERWYVGHAHEIGDTPGISVQALRRDSQRFAPRLLPRAEKVWRTWLAGLVPTLDEGPIR